MTKYTRFLFGLRKYLKGSITSAEALELAKEKLQERVATRKHNFLSLIKKGIFGYPKSPYLELFRAKKIGFSDINRWVESSGIEQTLTQLQADGVYFTVDEFKGKSEVQRNGLRFRVNDKGFDNPFLSAAYEVRSGATRSAGTRIRIDFDYLTQRSFYDAFLLMFTRH